MQNNASMMGLIPKEYFPPGVRFHPTDEELILYYLQNKVNFVPLSECIIGEVELYNYDPWNLPEKALYGDDEWYFFSPRDRKYKNGTRPNRTTCSGYWKATGTDNPILSSAGTRIGFKKALVFYSGKAPYGTKTDWVITEYRLPDSEMQSPRLDGSMRLDDWVLYRLRLKGNKSNNGQVTSINQVDYLPSVTSVPSQSSGTRSNSGVGYYQPSNWHIPDTHMANQELPPLELNPGTPQSTNTGEHFNLVYDNAPSKEIFETNYTLQDLLKEIVEDEFKENGEFKTLQQPNKISTTETNSRDLLSNDVYPTNVASYYDQLLLQDFIEGSSDVLANLQEFNRPAI
ncbi:DNA-binding transcription factor [Lithospermum erythrorhizon]|uniref:DNA-binding transcription factor n=1 Tax=Lithospermum erythrorhizon TaxID=34254 RepID=A0AAV3QJB0_LITER